MHPYVFMGAVQSADDALVLIRTTYVRVLYGVHRMNRAMSNERRLLNDIEWAEWEWIVLQHAHMFERAATVQRAF